MPSVPTASLAMATWRPWPVVDGRLTAPCPAAGLALGATAAPRAGVAAFPGWSQKYPDWQEWRTVGAAGFFAADAGVYRTAPPSITPDDPTKICGITWQAETGPGAVSLWVKAPATYGVTRISLDGEEFAWINASGSAMDWAPVGIMVQPGLHRLSVLWVPDETDDVGPWIDDVRLPSSRGPWRPVGLRLGAWTPAGRKVRELVPWSVFFRVEVDGVERPSRAFAVRIDPEYDILHMQAEFPAWQGDPPAGGTPVTVWQVETAVSGASDTNRLYSAQVVDAQVIRSPGQSVCHVSAEASLSADLPTVRDLSGVSVVAEASDGKRTVSASITQVLPGDTVRWGTDSMTAGRVTVSRWPGGAILRVVEA